MLQVNSFHVCSNTMFFCFIQHTYIVFHVKLWDFGNFYMRYVKFSITLVIKSKVNIITLFPTESFTSICGFYVMFVWSFHSHQSNSKLLINPTYLINVFSLCRKNHVEWRELIIDEITETCLSESINNLSCILHFFPKSFITIVIYW